VRCSSLSELLALGPGANSIFVLFGVFIASTKTIHEITRIISGSCDSWIAFTRTGLARYFQILLFSPGLDLSARVEFHSDPLFAIPQRDFIANLVARGRFLCQDNHGSGILLLDSLLSIRR
jgi:hypothetical protein